MCDFVILIWEKLDAVTYDEITNPNGFGKLNDRLLLDYKLPWSTMYHIPHTVHSTNVNPTLDKLYMQYIVKKLTKKNVKYTLLTETNIAKLKPLTINDNIVFLLIPGNMSYKYLHGIEIHVHLNLLGRCKNLTFNKMYILGEENEVNDMVGILTTLNEKSLDLNILRDSSVKIFTEYNNILIDLVNLQPITTDSEDWLNDNEDLNIFDLVINDVTEIRLGTYDLTPATLNEDDVRQAVLLNHLK